MEYSAGTANAIRGTTLGMNALPRFSQSDQAKLIAALLIERDNKKRVDFDARDFNGALTWDNTYLGRVFWSRAHNIYQRNKEAGHIIEVIG